MIEILGIIPDTVPDIQSTLDQNEVQTFTWTDYEITVTGLRTPEGLDEVRIVGGGTR